MMKNVAIVYYFIKSSSSTTNMMDSVAPWFVLFKQTNDNKTKNIWTNVFEVKKSLNVNIKKS